MVSFMIQYLLGCIIPYIDTNSYKKIAEN